MKNLWKIIIALLLVVGLAGCGSDDDDLYSSGGGTDSGGTGTGSGGGTDSGGGSGTPPSDDTPDEGKTDFTAFVKDLLASTSETTEPVAINDIDFEFNDNENPNAYDDVLPDDGG